MRAVHPIERLFAAAVLTLLASDIFDLLPAEPARIPLVLLGTCGLIDGALRLLIRLVGANAPFPMENSDAP